MRYEIASALTRSIVGGTLDSADAEAAWRQIATMPNFDLPGVQPM